MFQGYQGIKICQGIPWMTLLPMPSAWTKYFLSQAKLILSQTKIILSLTKTFCPGQNILSTAKKFISSTFKPLKFTLPDKKSIFFQKKSYLLTFWLMCNLNKLLSHRQNILSWAKSFFLGTKYILSMQMAWAFDKYAIVCWVILWSRDVYATFFHVVRDLKCPSNTLTLSGLKCVQNFILELMLSKLEQF